MTKMKHNRLKDTQAIWIPKIPEYWDLIKVRHLFKETTIKGFPDEPLLVASQEHGVVNKNVFGKRTMEATKDFHLLKLVEEGDFVISLRSFQGGIELAHQRGIISPAYTILKERTPINKRYFKHLFKSKPFISLMTLCVKGIRDGQNIDYPTFKNEYLPFPPIEEQEKIGAYLDRKTQQIQEFIQKKERLIELLEEKKDKQITNAISKGVLQNIEFKDTGEVWLNEIPKHWEFKALKHYVRLNVASITERTNPNYLLKYIDIGNVTFSGLLNEPEEMIFAIAPSRARRIVNSGDTILSTVRTYLKAIAFFEKAEENLIASTGFAVLSPKRQIIPKYLKYLLSSSYFLHKVNFWAIGVNYPSINNDRLMAIKVAIPPTLKEQKEIIEFIEMGLEKYNKTISKAQLEIEKAKEYQESLITQVVSGQLKVPEKTYSNVHYREFDMVAEQGSSYHT